MRRSFIALFALFTVVFLLLPQILSYAEEDADSISIESLFYDDRVDMTGKEVAIIDAGTPTSYQVGYGVEKNTVLDTAVVTLDGDTLIATGIGKAIVQVDGTPYEVTVSAAPISLLLLIGQSNMRGSEGDANQSIVCPDGMVYSSHGDDRGTANPVMTLANARQFAASALAGEYCSINVEGTTDCVSGYPLHNLTDTGTGKIGLDSGLGYEWVKQTGEKVWLVNAAVGGTKIASWQPGASCYKKATALFSACQETLQAEISAGHYTLSHMGYFWCQGCSDYDQTAEWYANKFLTMHNRLMTEMAFDHDGDASTPKVTFEFAGIIPVRAGHSYFAGYRDGVSTDTTTAKYYESFLDLRLNGPRVAQYWLANNPELPEIWMVCNIGEDWVWMPDGTNGVTQYFQAHYANGTVDYTTQVKQSASWCTPTTPKAVHDSIHYNQIGYNELGRESARNTLIMLGMIETPQVDMDVRLLAWDGYTEIDAITACASGESGTLVVPVVYPVWKSKDFEYTLSDGLRWHYYDLLATDSQTAGMLTVDGNNVEVHRDLYREHLQQLPEKVCCGLNLWNELEHDAQHYTAEAGWRTDSSSNICSVTIPTNPGDWICATSFGAAGTNGHSSTNGICVTFFGEYSVVKSMTPAEVYSAFVANDGYLVVPAGTVAVNIPMWNSSDDNELYLLNREHVSADSTQTVDPTCTDEGVMTFACGICGGTSTEAIPATGHTEETIPAVAPTCTNTGLTAGVKCTVCDVILTTQEEVAALGHAYDDGVQTTAPTYTKEGVKTFTCTSCSDTYTETIPALDYSESNPYKGKVFSIMGDSISTFAGYIPTADGFNRTHLARYPQDNLLTDVYATWWMQTIVDLQAKLGINDSWRGATVSGAHAVTSGDTGENAAMSNLVRIQNLGSNGTPDVILFYGGTNDIAHVSKIGSFDPESAPSTVDLTTTKWDNLAEGYAHTLLRMKHYYPDAVILALLPTYTASYYSDARLAQANETLVDICEYYGVPYIDLRDCGITADDLPDGIHPGEHGMDLITAAVIDALLTIDVPEGENVVYSVTHNLSNATASRGYYKGVSAGTSFEETLTGDNLSVTVTMGGKDITAACYSDGQIFIEKVTGALEITARSPFSLGDHLQEIPSEAYNNTNLWQVLKPEKGYFKGAEWVNNYSSVTIPVTAGDQLWATSFGASGENGGSMNGIRVTYFDAYGMLATIEPDAVYEEFQQNGYLTVPEGASAVCITMWTNTNAELYLLTLPDGPVLPGSHLQEIPSPVCSGINLWQVLEPEKGYFKGATWVDYYSSVTIPVTAGDQLWATSFGASGENGGTINGIRVTYFDVHGMLVSLEATEVYEEFQENGYVTVPENAVSVNVVMWNGDASDELYILNLEHSYDNGIETVAPSCIADGTMTFTCEICGDTYTAAIPATGHTEETIPSVAATCTDTGMTAGVKCTVCGEVLTAQEVVPATGHAYDDGVQTTAPTYTKEGVKTFTCTSCGETYTEVIPALRDTAGNESTPYQGKVFSIMGGSCSTFAGYIPTADGFNLAHRARYPQDNLLTDVNETWWMQVLTELGAKLGINDSWAGSQVLNTLDANSGDLGPDAAMASLVRIQNLGSNGTPDVILFYGAGNDIGRAVPLGEFDPDTAPQTVDLSTTKWDTFADAYVAAILRMKHFYPSSNIVVMLYHSMPSYFTNAELNEYNALIQAICDHYNIPTIDLRNSGVTADMLPDKIHPNAEGMDLITQTVLDELMKDCTVTPGENVVYSVTHELTNATASKHYYKGISAGHSFSETITGSTVTVTMNGIDITSTCYSDGTITIPEVTGDVVITAKGVFNADGHLQQLPDRLCCGINLWTVLEPENIYYTVNGWGLFSSAPNVHSITFPVTPGNKIWATSFQAAGTNGNTANATRITWFNENGVLRSVARDEVYAEFVKYGYITVPEGAIALNLPMARNDSSFEVYVTATTFAAGHSYGDGIATVAPSCTADGTMTFTCEICSGTSTEAIPAVGHTEEAIPAVAPSCTDTGLTEGVQCSICGEVLTVPSEVAALGHSHIAVITAPTCTEKGFTTYTCHCGDSYVADEVAATGHSYDDGVITTTPACTAGGVKTFTCEVCGDSYTETISATGHTEEAIPAVAPTCTATGLTAGMKCSACGGILTTQTEVAALGHSYDDGIETTSPTCTEEGIKTFTCTVCGNAYTEPVPATGHTQEVIPAVAPSCTTAGLTAGVKCSVCGEILTAQTEVPALGHSYNSGVETTAPSCTAAGVKTFTCFACGNSYTESIPALGHTEAKLPAVAPTCTTVGQTEGLHCSVCGTVFMAQEILPAVGHTEGEPVITVEPTVQTAGIRSVFCDTCGELLRSESITVTGSLYIPGDADDNGCVDIYDALLVMQYSAGWDVTPNLLNADINKDGVVGLFDAVMILQYCAGTSFDSALRALLEKAEELLIDVMTILEHPQDQHVIEGQQAVFKLSAAGEGLQYQWYIDRGNGNGWRPIAGATSDTYTLSAVQMTDDGCLYRCGITDASGRQIMSNPATLYVEPAVELPQTGDQSNLLLWATLMAVSLCGMIGLVVAGKRHCLTKSVAFCILMPTNWTHLHGHVIIHTDQSGLFENF